MCGSPVEALQELLHGNLDLPAGAIPHLLGLLEEQRGVMEHKLKDFKGGFPAEFPKHVPPDRGQGDMHEIPNKSGRVHCQEDLLQYSQVTALNQVVA